MKDIFETDTPAKATTLENHRNEITLMVDILNTYISGFNMAAERNIKIEDDMQGALIAAATMSFHSSYCAYHLSVSGFYTQANALIRQITENWLVCATCQNNKQVILDIANGKQLNYYDLAKSIKMGKDIYSEYKLQSKFTHITDLSISILSERETNNLRFLPTYDKFLFLCCCAFFFKYTGLMLQYLYKFLLTIDKIKAEEWDTNTSKIIVRINNWVKEFEDSKNEDKNNPLS